MEQYISKSAVIAAIRNKVDSYRGGGIISISVLKQHCEDFIDSLDSLEVREVGESTADDRGMAEKIIINLKRVEQDYHIDLTKEMEWIRNKSRKGE